MAAAVGAIGLGTTLAGGVLGAFGAEKSAAAQQQMYDYQSQVAKLNAQIDLQNRDYAIQQGERQAVQYGMKAAQTEGQIKVAQSGSGLDVNAGSALSVQRSEAKVAAMDLDQIRTNAGKVAYDYTVKSSMDLNQATLDTMAGINARTAGDIQAAQSILGAAGSVSSKWMQGQQAGMLT